MAHGSGGRTGAELMENIFGKYFTNDILDRMEDGAVFEISGKIAYSTDSFVVTPLKFPGGNIGKLAVCGTVNDLAMMGAQPKYLTCGFIMEEGLSIELLEEIVRSMAEEAKAAGVKIVAGDTKVIEGKGGLYINTSGIGIIPEGRSVSAANCQKGDAVILSGTLGNHHACILSCRMGIENSISSDCGNLSPLVETLFQNGIKVRAMRDVTRGGLGTILNELAESSGVGIGLEQGALPLDPEVKAFSDILGLDPLYMANEGRFVAVVAPEDKERTIALLRQTPAGSKAALIGAVDEGKGVRLETPIGGSRVVDVLYGEGLPRIC